MNLTKKLSIFCISLLIAVVSGLWVIRGFIENSKYYRITATITSISDFSAEQSNRYRVLENGEEIRIPIARVTYMYSDYYYKSFIIEESDKDKYHVGDEMLYYGFKGTNYIDSAYSARARMADNLTVPILIFLVSFINLFSTKIFPQRLREAAAEAPGIFKFSVVLMLLCAWCTIYALFIYEDNSMFFGFGEFFVPLGSVVLTFIAVVIEAVVWGRKH